MASGHMSEIRGTEVRADQAGRTRRGFVSTACAVAARAGGSSAPYEGIEQNKKLCNTLRQQIYRGGVAAICYLQGVQGVASYPASTKEPSLGTPPIWCSARTGVRRWRWLAPNSTRRQSG